MKYAALLARGGLVIALLLAVAGCDKLPWSSKGDPSQTAKTAQTTAQSAAAPSKPTVLPGDVVAAVNGVPISKQDVELRLQELKLLVANLNRPWTPLTAEQLEAVVEELVNNELMSQDAVSRGLDRNTQTQSRWAYVHRGFFVQEWLRWKQERLDVGSNEVEDYYNQNKPGFRIPERRRLRQLVVTSEDQAKQALAQLLAGAVEFSALAQQISLGPTAAKGGLLEGWVMRERDRAFAYPSQADAASAGVTTLEASLEAAAFAIDQVNGLSNYVKGGLDNRYHLFQLVERQPEREQPLTEVWNQIKSYLELQRLQQALKELRETAKIERHPEHLEGVTQ